MNDIAIIEDTFQNLKDKPADYIAHWLKKLGGGDEATMVDGLWKIYKMGVQKYHDELRGTIFLERCVAYANGQRDGMFKGTIIGAEGVIVVGAASYGIIKLIHSCLQQWTRH